MLMKLIAFVLVWGSLVLGTIAASTAYLPSLDAVEAVVEGGEAPLTLAANAGVHVDEDGERTTVLKSGDRLDVASIARLRGEVVEVEAGGDADADGAAGAADAAGAGEDVAPAGAATAGVAGASDAAADAAADDDPPTVSAEPVERVRVKEFAFGRWKEWWMFVLSLAGLGAGAFVVRFEARRAVAAARAQAGAGRAAHVASPEAMLATARTRVDALIAEPAAAETVRLERILEVLAGVRSECMEPFVEERPLLIDRLGLSGFAQLMDHFASADRMLNRGWSAAADGVLAEAEECLLHVAHRLREAEQRVGSS